MRWITAGKSYGRALVAVVEGIVAGVEITSEIAGRLAGSATVTAPGRAARPVDVCPATALAVVLALS